MIYATIPEKYLVGYYEAELMKLFNSTDYHPFLHAQAWIKLAEKWLEWGGDAVLEQENSGEAWRMGKNMSKIVESKDILWEALPDEHACFDDKKSAMKFWKQITKYLTCTGLSEKLIGMYLESKPVQKALTMLGYETFKN